MPKKIDLEIREAFGKPFLKVFIHDLENIEKVKQVISQCGSVGKVNIYKTGENLTVYPNQVYSIEELQDEVRLVLSTLYEGSPIDPVFIEEPISKISEKAYAQIIDNIIRFGKELEKKPQTYSKFEEEQLRDQFQAMLNLLSRNHTATGETFNKLGRTDLIIQDNDGNNVFIAEFKIWRGQSELKKAVSQLIEKYVMWRDDYTALVVFNNNVAGFTSLIQKAIESVKQHELYHSTVFSNDGVVQFKFLHKEDDKKTLLLILLLFDLNY